MPSDGNHHLSRHHQMERLIHIVSVLKQNRTVTVDSLVNDFREKSRSSTGEIMECSAITVKRDIKTLKQVYGCPVYYERAEKTFRLNNIDWEFPVPSIISKDTVIAAILGAKLAEDVFPPSISSNITRSVDEMLTNNSADLTDRTMVQSLKLFAPMGSAKDEQCFPIVFDAWKRHRKLLIRYEKPGLPPQERTVKPMSLVFVEKKWYLYAFCEIKKEYRKFAISRINYAEKLKEVFDPDLAAIENLTPKTFLDYDHKYDVTLRITSKAKAYVDGSFYCTTPVIKQCEDGTYTLFLPDIPLEAVVPWVLAQGGDAVVISPSEVVDAVTHAANAVLDASNQEHSHAEM